MPYNFLILATHPSHFLILAQHLLHFFILALQLSLTLHLQLHPLVHHRAYSTNTSTQHIMSLP
jgi:hypothetical protein